MLFEVIGMGGVGLVEFGVMKGILLARIIARCYTAALLL
jgi:hypothetical protein